MPILEEIIDAIGPRYQGIARLELRWEAYALRKDAIYSDESALAPLEQCITAQGESPEEAVAELWLLMITGKT